MSEIKDGGPAFPENLQQFIRELGDKIPCATGGTFRGDPLDAIISAAISHIDALLLHAQHLQDRLNKMEADKETAERQLAELQAKHGGLVRAAEQVDREFHQRNTSMVRKFEAQALFALRNALAKLNGAEK